MTPTRPGKRELNKELKRARIHEAAREVFLEKGYNAATTKEIARRAGVGMGTLFLYAPTKAELLLWIGRDMLDIPPAPPQETLLETAMRVLSPLLDLASVHPENFVAYQRELMFGPEGHFRRDALEGIAAMECTVGDALIRDLGAAPPGLTPEELGRSFMSMIFVELVRLCMHVETREELEALIPHRLQLFRDGLAAQLDR